MLDQEPLWYPSRGPFNPGVSNRQLLAIGMIVVQWGLLELVREQSVYNLMGDDAKLIGEYKRQRKSQLKTRFWKSLVMTKKQDPERTRDAAFITRYETLNNQRDDIIHRMWGGGMEAGSAGVPADAPTTEAWMHRNPDEKIKTKSADARHNLRARFTFSDLRQIANNMAKLSQEIFTSWMPPGTPPGTRCHIWAYENSEGRLEIGVASATESEPHIRG